VWWAWEIANGCNEDFEVTCSFQPVATAVIALMLLASWLGGVGTGVSIRRFANRNGNPS
jgi:hypothetical protein